MRALLPVLSLALLALLCGCAGLPLDVRSAPILDDQTEPEGFPLDVIDVESGKLLVFAHVLQNMRGDQAYRLETWPLSANVRAPELLIHREVVLEILPTAGQIIRIENNGPTRRSWDDLKAAAIAEWAERKKEAEAGDKAVARRAAEREEERGVAEKAAAALRGGG